MAFTGPHLAEYNQLSSDTVARAQLGSEIGTADGRSFRYCKNSSTALVAGDLQQGPAIVANHQGVVIATTAAGSTSVTVTLGATAATANQYAGGYLIVDAGTGAGLTYLIKSHPAASASATLVLTLSEPIKVATAVADSTGCLIPNPFNAPVISATAQTGTAVGVAPIALPASEFGWLQTKGICGVRADETFAAGAALTIGTGVAGEVEALDAAGEQQIGVAYQTGVDNARRAVYLTLP